MANDSTNDKKFIEFFAYEEIVIPIINEDDVDNLRLYLEEYCNVSNRTNNAN